MKTEYKLRIQTLREMTFGYKAIVQNVLQKCLGLNNLKLMFSLIADFFAKCRVFFSENLFSGTLLSKCYALLAGDLQKSYFVFQICFSI